MGIKIMLLGIAAILAGIALSISNILPLLVESQDFCSQLQGYLYGTITEPRSNLRRYGK